MSLKKSLTIAVILSFLGIAGWEVYWRAQGYYPELDDDKYLWAKTRAKVEDAGKNEVVIVGSSRALFDIQLDVWEEYTGTRPIQLASPGSTPLPIFSDLVNRTDFSGTAIVGVTPGLFFSTTYPKAPPWDRAQKRVSFYHERTYAQRLNYFLWVPLLKTFAFLANDEENWADDLNLKNFIDGIQIGKRTEGPTMPPFYRFSEIDLDRNVRMKEKVVTDTAFANSIKKVWEFFVSGDRPPPDREGTISFFAKDAEEFINRGGNLILVRCPADGFLLELETQNFPREEFWDELVEQTGATAYHYSDYEVLTGFDLPEWSHLSARDADAFTRELVNILIADQNLSKLNN